MARVPTYNSPVVQARPMPAPQLTYQQIDVPRGAFDNGGAGLVAAGERLMGAADKIQSTVLKMQAEETATKAAEMNGVMTQWEIAALHDPQSGAFARKGKDADGLSAQIGKDFDDAYRKARDGAGIGDPRALAELHRQALERKATIISRVERHEQQQMQQYRSALGAAAVDSAVTGAVDAYTDPGLVEQRLGAAERTLRSNLTGQPEEEINRQVAGLYSRGLSSVIMRHLAEGDVTAARKWYEANRGHLSADDHLHVLGKLEPSVLDAEARRIADGLLTGTAGVPGAGPSGVEPGLVDAIVAAESGGNADAKNPNSSATGAGQFINSTWLETVRRHRPDLAGQDDAALLALRSDPALSREMTARLAADNAEALGKQVLPASAANLMLAHRFGAAGAVALLKAGPSTAIGEVVGREVMAANPDLAGKSVGDVLAQASERVAGVTQAGPAREAALVAQARALPNARLANLVEAWVRSGIADQEKAERERERMSAEQSARSLSDLEIRLMRGQADLPDIEAAYDAGQGWLSPKDRTRLIAHQEERRRLQAEADADFARVGEAVAGLGTLDPRSERDRKAVAAHYAAQAGSWRNLPEQEQIDRMAQAATRYGMVPDQVRAGVRGSLRRVDKPEMVVQAADVIERLRHANPDLLKDFSQEDISLGNLVGSYARAGLPPAEAVRLATEAAKVPEAERVARKDAYAAMVKDSPSASADTLRNSLVGGWVARHLPLVGVPNVDPPPELVSEFDRVAEAEFSRHGNLDAARKTAIDAVRRVWGISSIGGLTPDGSGASGGARLMRHPPELFYGRSGIDAEANGAWMREQLVADMKQGGGLFDASAGEQESRFMLAPDPSRTDPTTGGPLYQVWLRSRDGSLSALRSSDQQPVLWRPDWDTSPAAERQRQQIEAMRTGRAYRRSGGLKEAIDQAVVTAADPNIGVY